MEEGYLRGVDYVEKVHVVVAVSCHYGVRRTSTTLGEWST
jgi:hypothetical protein